ncbi:uroporphyrinogen-III synthase [Cellulomonas sp. S1-8]|uniref:uroporphyrinogen-III synthase n=1 Tax=Cellulomonas sp. S1-8 TaxID=2904790 RepID=UPI002244E22E|nr:uroporphyrinogen-III synthase [Cellulomonas sp. S1-8]UZN03170.1 uroporphyrinogen-III synthase [Cellulomonas sp. S1-8]
MSPAAVAVAAAGGEPLVVPLVRTVPVDDLRPLDDALLALGAGWYPWLAVTSQAAVAVLAERAGAYDDGLAALVGRSGALVGAVGPGTARALEALGVRVDVVPPVRSTAADLVVALVAAARRSRPPATTSDDAARDTPDATALAGPGPAGTAPRVLFPRGDLAAATLADGLTAAGWTVDDLVVYRTVPAGPPEPHVARAWAAGDVHAALLTSASSVRALLDHLGPPPPATRVVVIGPSTAAEALRLGVRVDAVASRQTLAGLVDALTDLVARTDAVPGTPPGTPPATARDTPPATPPGTPPPTGPPLTGLPPTPTEDAP